jgi:hypothetical protein
MAFVFFSPILCGAVGQRDINYVPRRGEICQFLTFLQQKRIIFRQLKFNAISCSEKMRKI